VAQRSIEQDCPSGLCPAVEPEGISGHRALVA
jgi:hypothetical protein